MFPIIKVSQKTLYTCNLVLPREFELNSILKWLEKNKCSDIETFTSQDKITIKFTTQEEDIVVKLQERCFERAQKAASDFKTKQKRSQPKNLLKQLQATEKELNKLKYKDQKQSETIKRLKNTSQRQNDELQYLSRLKQKEKTDNSKLLSEPLLESDQCFLCGSPTVPGSGICRDCES